MTATTQTSAPTIGDALGFIHTASHSDLQALYAALTARQSIVRADRFIAGVAVRIVDASPKYLNGLEATVVRLTGDSVTITLSEASTSTLRAQISPRFDIPSRIARYVMNVPVGTCEVL